MISKLRHILRAMMFGVTALIVQTSHAEAAELVMFESEICEWCDAWHAEIGPIYSKTEEGKLAPLRTVDIHDQRPGDLAGIEGVRFTPTFVLLDEGGREVGRINGYPGEDFFWGLLGELIAELTAEPKPMTEAQAEPLVLRLIQMIHLNAHYLIGFASDQTSLIALFGSNH